MARLDQTPPCDDRLQADNYLPPPPDKQIESELDPLPPGRPQLELQYRMFVNHLRTMTTFQDRLNEQVNRLNAETRHYMDNIGSNLFEYREQHQMGAPIQPHASEHQEHRRDPNVESRAHQTQAPVQPHASEHEHHRRNSNVEFTEYQIQVPIHPPRPVEHQPDVRDRPLERMGIPADAAAAVTPPPVRENTEQSRTDDDIDISSPPTKEEEE